MSGEKSNARSGFILPTVIWTVTALALIAAVTTEWVSHAVDQAYARSIRAEAERQIAESESQVLYLLTSEPLSGRGIEIFDQQLKLKSRSPIFDVNEGTNCMRQHLSGNAIG